LPPTTVSRIIKKCKMDEGLMTIPNAKNMG